VILFGAGIQWDDVMQFHCIQLSPCFGVSDRTFWIFLKADKALPFWRGFLTVQAAPGGQGRRWPMSNM
jgi:hypothetical protein